MAAGSLAEPGTEYGPCENPCEHRDCAASREQAATECVVCDKPIGYGRNFYRVDKTTGWKDLAHATCWEKLHASA